MQSKKFMSYSSVRRFEDLHGFKTFYWNWQRWTCNEIICVNIITLYISFLDHSILIYIYFESKLFKMFFASLHAFSQKILSFASQFASFSNGTYFTYSVIPFGPIIIGVKAHERTSENRIFGYSFVRPSPTDERTKIFLITHWTEDHRFSVRPMTERAEHDLSSVQ